MLKFKVTHVHWSRCVQVSKMRLPPMQYIAAMLGVVIFSFLFYPNRKFDPNSNLINFLHLLLFSTHFGAQVWITFIGGLTIYFNVPRIWFGRLQSRLFPMFFCSAFVMAVGTLATFVIQHPHDMWKSSHFFETVTLSVSMTTSFINAFILSPIIIELVTQRFALEEGTGLENCIGFVDLSEMKKNPEYLRIHQSFRSCHGLSGIVNLVSLVANLIHLYSISSKCAFV